MSRLVRALCASACIATATTARAQDSATSLHPPPPQLFYHDVPYGSEAIFNPFTVVLGGAYDIFRNHSYQDSPFRVDYRTAFGNVAENLARPDRVLAGDGWQDLIAHEIFPYRGFAPEYGQFLPNWIAHLLGEGMLARKLGEWYAQRQVPAPYVFGALTTFVMQVLNEVAENGSYRGVNPDPVADMYLFNPAGLLLFTLDPVARFFAGPLRINYWPGQPVLDLRTGELFNHGENYAFKIDLGPWTTWRGFFYFGVEGLFGASAPVRPNEDLSFGVGPRLLDLKVDAQQRDARVLVPAGPMNVTVGAFWDRDESLLASVLVGGPANYYLHINVYPGVLAPALPGFGPQSLGLFVLAGQRDGISAGIALREVPVSVSTTFRKDRSGEIF